MATSLEPGTGELAPEVPRLHPIRWVRENLFSSVWSGILTVVFGLALLVFLFGVLSFIFGDEPEWSSVSTNSRLYGSFAYPEAQYSRIWVSLGIAVVLMSVSLVAWGNRPRAPVSQVARVVSAAGWLVVLVALLSPWSPGARLITILIAGGGALAAQMVQRMTSRRAEPPDVSLLSTVVGLLTLGVLSIWVLPEIVEPIVIASSTKVPLTILLILGVAVYFGGLALLSVSSRRTMQVVLIALWLLSLPVIYLVILRDPAFDYDTIRGEDLWIALILGVAGSVLLWFVSAPGERDRAHILGGITLILALAVWFPPLNDLVPWIKARLPLLLLAVLALAAPSFGGNVRARRGLVGAWIAGILLTAYFLAVGQAEATVRVETDLFGGLVLTLVLSFAGLLLAFPLGILLALGRTSTMPIFRILSTGYIEFVRGVPLITILFFGALFLPLFLPSDIVVDRVLRAIIAIALFSAAYLAENVRGGLQSISRGQYEAARAVGMNTVQMTLFITLPQALRAVIPAIVGQIISLFKDTSLVLIIGLAEILAIASRLVPNQPAFIGSQRENLLFVALVYWMFTFTFSRASQRLERRLGVGLR